jgi:hypothetical protein
VPELTINKQSLLIMFIEAIKDGEKSRKEAPISPHTIPSFIEMPAVSL